MADDQVKYSDLISDDVAKGIAMLDEALKGLRDTMASLKDMTVNSGESIKGMGTVTKEQQQVIAKEAAEIEALNKKVKDLTDKIKKLEDVKLHYRKLTDDQITSLKAFQAALQGSSKQVLDAVNAIEIEKKSYNELNAIYNTLKDSLNAMTIAERQNSEAGKAMTVQSAKIYDTMNELQKATGKYTLQVGKYRAAFDGLGYSFQQILREAPSALNLNQFFLAISNNIPMFTDQLKAFRDEQKEIKANLAQMTEGTKEYAEQLGKVESVGKKLARTLFSWQSLVVTGLMILRNWDRIVSGISSLFSNLTKEQKQLKEVNEAAAGSIGEMTAKYEALRKEWMSLSEVEKPKFVEQHKNDWIELGYSIDDAKKAEDFYVNNTSAVQQAIDARARSIAAMKLAAEKYEEAFKKQVESENAVKNLDASGWNRAKQVVMAFGSTVTSGGVMMPWNRKKISETMKADAEAYAEDLAEEAEELRQEAYDLIHRFVLPEQGKTIKEIKEEPPKNPKEPTEQNVTDRYWESEKALLEAQQEGYDLERSLAKLNRDKARDEQINWYVDQRLALDENLKNGFISREQYNTAVAELERQNKALMIGIANQYNAEISKINKKQADEELKAKKAQKEAAEKAAKEEEKQEKENAKGKLKAAVDGWAQYKAKMVEEGKTRKQIVEAEVAAEIARLNLMLKLNRDVNGEIMSDEQKTKVQEWINLLEKLQKTGNYGDYKPGQFMGKGGANVTNERKSYANIWEVLGIDMDNNQVSALNSVFDQAKEALNSWMDARKAAADQAKELADDEVSAAENALNREIELRNQGYANDVALREKELADAKAAQKKAAEEQKKVAQEQVLLDAALQTSSMITASANIIKQFPNPLAWAPMLALMWGTFAYAKTKAYQASTKSIKFKEGGVMLLEGGSHESGHDVNLGVGPDGSNLRAEGHEYFAVFNKPSSSKYHKEIPAVVNAFNRGVFEDKYIKTSDAVGLLPQVIRADNGTAVDLSSLEGGVDALVKQGEQNWTIEGGYRVLRYKNLTRRVKIG